MPNVYDEIDEVFRDRLRRVNAGYDIQVQLCLGALRGLTQEQAQLSDRLDKVERRLPPMRFRRRWFRRRNRLVRAGGNIDWLATVGMQRTWAKHDAPSVERASSELGVSPLSGSTPHGDSERQQYTLDAQRDAGTPDAERENDPGSERDSGRPVNPSYDAEVFDLTAGLPLQHQPGPVPGWMWVVSGLALVGLLLALALMGMR